jgi:anaerobic glycerol-3-phosphate dehydrogenase
MTSRSFSAVIKELDGDLARTVSCVHCIYPWSNTIQRTERQRASVQTWEAQSLLPFRRTCGLAGYLLFSAHMSMEWLLIVQSR